MDKLAVATAKALIGLEGRSRALEGAVFKTFLTPADHRVGKAAALAGKRYQEAARGSGKKHNHGQPFLNEPSELFLAAVAQEAQGEEKEAMKFILSAHRNGPSSLTQLVTFCTCKEAFKGEGYKLQFAVTQEGQQSMKLVENHLNIAGREEKHGQAPRGPAARELIFVASKDSGRKESEIREKEA